MVSQLLLPLPLVKPIAHIFTHLAMLLMLLHNIVPHQHHGEDKDEEHCLAETSHEDDSLFDLLGDIFHTDLGDDHLENLRNAEGDLPVFISPAILAEAQKRLEQPLVISSVDDYRQPEDLALPDFLTPTLRPLRGPPSGIQA